MKYLLSIALLIISTASFSQGYNLDFKVKGWKDTTVYLGLYTGEQTYVRDTARINTVGEFNFKGKNKLAHGVYFLVLNTNKIFDFVISNDQEFLLETSTEDFVKNMVVKGDEDNKVFFENILFNMERNKEAEPLVKQYRDEASTAAQKKSAEEGLKQINEKVMAYQDQIISRNPEFMTSRLLKATRNVEIPAHVKKVTINGDSTAYQLKWYREHFFDNFNLGDDALLHLPKPIYLEKIKFYAEKLYAPNPDTVMKAINFMVEKAKRNPDTYKYLVWNMIFNYQNPEIMGLDQVFVKLHDQYIASGEMDYWLDAATKKNVKDFAQKLNLGKIGSTATDMTMLDQNLQPKRLFDIKSKYTIIFFFSPTCSHCKEETPKLVDFYTASKTKFDFEVFAVSADTSMADMKKFIKEFRTPWITVNGPRTTSKQHFSAFYQADTTPFIYVIDRQKKVIAKKLSVAQLEEFLTKHENFLKAKAAATPGTKGSQ